MFSLKNGSGMVTDYVETVTVTEKTDQDGSDKRDLEVESVPFTPTLLCFMFRHFNNILFRTLQSNLHFYHYFGINSDQEIPEEDDELVEDEEDHMLEIEWDDF